MMLAIDQYGQHYHIQGKAPRKELTELFGVKHVERMYIDGENGRPKHIGYVIAGLWLTLFRLSPWEGADGR